ncbi:hypothetical protein EVAR_39470_1 [Eumeta japonica]|uniref:Uncharacterized protein n=1 Tax=Eumeta variegata TaxID=151549 RepID=A0A4C1W1N3_EUMVA|nr:hypothetical protein EVAR_39470_1 [Eumeta japonica]
MPAAARAACSRIAPRHTETTSPTSKHCLSSKTSTSHISWVTIPGRSPLAVIAATLLTEQVVSSLNDRPVSGRHFENLTFAAVAGFLICCQGRRTSDQNFRVSQAPLAASGVTVTGSHFSNAAAAARLTDR